jgi:hypothetical protein
MGLFPTKLGSTGSGASNVLTAAELDVLDGVTLGTTAASKVVTTSAANKVVALDVTALSIDGTAVTATASQLNALTSVASVSKTIAVAAMTDNAGTATGYIDFTASALPAKSIVLGWKCVTSAGFAGDTSAVVQVGIAGTLDLYSATTTGSVFTAVTCGSVVKTTGTYFQTAAATPRVTITGAADFTSIVTNAAGACVVTIYYIPVA